jgi:enoyl-CoA hydratase/carnithine racemase
VKINIGLTHHTAEFSLSKGRLGPVLGVGEVFRFSHQLPLKTAMRLLLTGGQINAQRALSFGLVSEVETVVELHADTVRWAQELLRCAQLSQHAIQQAVQHAWRLRLEQAFIAICPEKNAVKPPMTVASVLGLVATLAGKMRTVAVLLNVRKNF